MNAKLQGAWNGQFRAGMAGEAAGCGLQADASNGSEFMEVA